MRLEAHTLPGVDEDARTIAGIDRSGTRFPIGKMDAHRRGVLHDAVSVFLFDGKHTLLQRRALGKYHCGGLWANACCTHPDWGEDAATSARRRLGEELGLDLTLNLVSETTYRASVGNDLTEHERVRIFTAHVDRGAVSFSLDPNEVAEVHWMHLDDLHSDAEDHPERYAPWLRIYLQRWDTLGLL